MFQLGGDPVPHSAELARILALPRRPPLDFKSSRAEALVELMTTRLRRVDRPLGAPCGCRELGRSWCLDRLLPSQAWALWEAPLAGGLFGALGVGSGKTLLDILMPMVMGSKTAALLLPPGLVRQLSAEYLAAREHFRVPSLILPSSSEHPGWVVPGAPALHVVPYSRFSRPEATELLERLDPDLVLGDEIHALKNPQATRTRRATRYFACASDFTPLKVRRLCGWSGTITSDSIRNFAHLIAFALGEGSPFPIDPSVVDEWASALDPSDWPAPPGALKKLCANGESAVEGIHRRLVETLGVVSTRATSSCDASIFLRERKAPPIPDELAEMIREVRKTWERPDGEELLDALSVSACARQLACGFYYRWRFPGKPVMEAIMAWFRARKAWGKEMREQLKHARPHMDSPRLLANAAQRHLNGYVTGRDGDLPTWKSLTWEVWSRVKDTIKHETETVWVDDYLAADAAKWAKTNKGVVWYDLRAFGTRVAALADLPLHCGGPKAEERILAEDGSRSVIASIDSHGTGRDGLQRHFSEQLVANPPSGGLAWEQLLGRLSRQGQLADEIGVEVYRHTDEMADAIDRAVRQAKYVEGLMGANQKLLNATVEWDL